MLSVKVVSDRQSDRVSGQAERSLYSFDFGHGAADGEYGSEQNQMVSLVKGEQA